MNEAVRNLTLSGDMILLEHLPFDTDNGIASRARIGLIVLATDYTIEYQMTMRALKHGLRIAEFPTIEHPRVAVKHIPREDRCEHGVGKSDRADRDASRIVLIPSQGAQVLLSIAPT